MSGSCADHARQGVYKYTSGLPFVDLVDVLSPPSVPWSVFRVSQASRGIGLGGDNRLWEALAYLGSAFWGSLGVIFCLHACFLRQHKVEEG